MSPTVVHSTVLAVRNFVDDITGWGWAERLARQLIFAGDVPRLPRPLPRALAPGADARLMAAVTELDDPFARCGLKLLRGAGLRLGELLDLELGSVIDYGPAGTWLKVPLGKRGTERSVRSTPRPSPLSTSGPHTAARNALIRTRGRAGLPTSCSANAANASDPGGSAPAWTRPSRPPG